jgi:hypothetical protein
VYCCARSQANTNLWPQISVSPVPCDRRLKEDGELKKITLFSLLLLVAVGCSGTALASGLTGSTVNWQYYAYGGAYTQNYGGGTSSGSFVVACTTCGNFDGYFLIDSSANSITFDYSVYTGSPTPWAASVLSLSPTIYNGIDLLFTGGPAITSVAIDPATNMVGFTTSYLSFTNGEIQVDWHSLPFDSTTIVKLDVNSSSSVPEPGSLFLLGTGLLGAVGVIRRKINL